MHDGGGRVGPGDDDIHTGVVAVSHALTHTPGRPMVGSLTLTGD